jgi:hypothetical protein
MVDMPICEVGVTHTTYFWGCEVTHNKNVAKQKDTAFVQCNSLANILFNS